MHNACISPFVLLVVLKPKSMDKNCFSFLSQSSQVCHNVAFFSQQLPRTKQHIAAAYHTEKCILVSIMCSPIIFSHPSCYISWSNLLSTLACSCLLFCKFPCFCWGGKKVLHLFTKSCLFVFFCFAFLSFFFFQILLLDMWSFSPNGFANT